MLLINFINPHLLRKHYDKNATVESFCYNWYFSQMIDLKCILNSVNDLQKICLNENRLH